MKFVAGVEFDSDLAYPSNISDRTVVATTDDETHANACTLFAPSHSDQIFTHDGLIFNPIVPTVGGYAFALAPDSTLLWARRIS